MGGPQQASPRKASLELRPRSGQHRHFWSSRVQGHPCPSSPAQGVRVLDDQDEDGVPHEDCDEMPGRSGMADQMAGRAAPSTPPRRIDW